MKSFVISNCGKDYSKEMRIDWSNDGINWEELETISVPVIEEKDLDNYYIKYFNVSNIKRVRMIRFVNTKERYKIINENKNVLVIFRLEIYGNLYLNCNSFLNGFSCEQISELHILSSLIPPFFLS